MHVGSRDERGEKAAAYKAPRETPGPEIKPKVQRRWRGILIETFEVKYYEVE